MTDSLQSTLYRRLDEAPDGRAFAWYEPSGEFAWLTFEEFMSRAMSTAARLTEEGLRPRDVCILVLPSEAASVRFALAVLSLGAVPLLIAPPLSQGMHSTLWETLRHTVRKTHARLVILPSTMGGLLDQLPRGGRTRYLPEERIPAGDDRQPSLARVTPSGSDVAAMQLTSGTTGIPRVCVWRHRDVLAGLAGMRAAMRLSSEDVCFNWTPLYHDMGLVNNFFLCMVHRVPLVMLSPFEFVKRPALWLRGLSQTGSTVTWSPNFGFAVAAQRIRDEEMGGVRLDRVRGFWNAAERIHLETMRAFHERFAPYGLRFEALKTNYGCAENVGGATFSDPAGTFPVEFVDREWLQRRRIARLSGSANGHGGESVPVVGVGRPYPGMEIEVLSPGGKPLPEGRVGEIALRTPSRMAGYLRDAAKSRRALFGDLLRTGDLGYLRGGELFWTGRVKERITVRGKKLDPSDFESILLRIPGLRQGSFAAFGIDDAVKGTQQVVIVAEVRDPPSRRVEEIVGDIGREVFLQLGLSAHEILLVGPGTLTKTSSGKRRHRYFRTLYLQGRLHGARFEQPLDSAP